jgi:hypothetical protein
VQGLTSWYRSKVKGERRERNEKKSEVKGLTAV